jgi:3-isopropylmalate/(R)-2-methylmalate dehydratase small subunit
VAKYEDLIAGDDGLLVMTGRAWLLGDYVERRHLLGDAHLDKGAADAARFVLVDLDPSLAGNVGAGDFLVAGIGFGVDATHRVVPAALKARGIGAVIARSFGHFFQHHALHVGLPALVVEETGAIRAGDRLRVDIEAHVVANLSSGDRYVIRNLDDGTLAALRNARPPERT